MKQGWLAAVLPVVTMLSGCGAGYDLDPTQAAEDVGSSQSAISNFDKYALGVIPLDPSSCPADKRIAVYTDDEDDDNESDSTGWDAPGTARRSRNHDTGRGGTHWDFCKVEGRDFHSFTKFASKTDYFYAALSLGTNCPNGSAIAFRASTGEIFDNRSSWSGPMGRNYFQLASGAAGPGGSVLYMFFCVFQASTDKMTEFPDLGMQYAVFHDYDSGQPSFVMSKKWAYSDDDDQNQTYTELQGPAGFEAIVSDGPNTMYDLARVR